MSAVSVRSALFWRLRAGVRTKDPFFIVKLMAVFKFRRPECSIIVLGCLTHSGSLHLSLGKACSSRYTTVALRMNLRRACFRKAVQLPLIDCCLLAQDSDVAC
jgi:hypothetical protein